MQRGREKQGTSLLIPQIVGRNDGISDLSVSRQLRAGSLQIENAQRKQKIKTDAVGNKECVVERRGWVRRVDGGGEVGHAHIATRGTFVLWCRT